MDTIQTLPSKAAGRSKPIDPARFLYAGTAALLLVLMFLGFQQFYLHGRAFPDRPLTPPIRMLLIAHGVSMTLWMALMLVQPLLIVNRQHRLHMRLGMAGAVLAACIFLLGWRVGISAARVAPPGPFLWNLTAKQFMTVPLISITVFAVFVAIGLVWRGRPEVHRPMMLLATLAAIPAGLDRIPAVGDLYRHTFWGPLFGPFFSSLVIGAAFLAVKTALTRSFDRHFALGWAVQVVVSAGVMQLATTQAWDGIADVLLRF